MSSKWLWQVMEKSPERLTEQEQRDLDLLALDPRMQVLRRYLEGKMWEQLSLMASSRDSEQDRWLRQGSYEAYRTLALRLEP